MVLAHGSGLDELAIFVFPVIMGLGFWLLTRQRSGAASEPDPETGKPTVARIASDPPNAVKPVNGSISPFHNLIRPPAPAKDDDAPAPERPATTSSS